MSPIPLNLAVEDQLSETILRTLLDFVDRDYHVGTCYGRTGFGYLRKTVRGFNQAAKGTPFLLLTDLDDHDCPPELIGEWLNVPPHHNLIFRVAVREVEAWLLADPTHLAEFLHISKALMPDDCDSVEDPKRDLVELARRSRSRDIRDRIVPKAGSTAQQGPDYNSCLSTFVTNHWDVDRACEASTSLRRTVERLRSFNPVWEENF